MRKTKRQKMLAAQKRLINRKNKTEETGTQERIMVRPGFNSDLTKLLCLTILAVGMILALRYAWR